MFKLIRTISRILLRLKVDSYWYRALIFGKVRYTDRFGLKYYLWPNTRLKSTVAAGVRSDDTGVMVCLRRILTHLLNDKRPLVCFDVGAFIGVMSLTIASRLKEEDVVYSFEPTPITYQRLVENVKLNRSTTIRPQNFALSDRDEARTLLIADNDPGTNMLIYEDDGGSSTQALTPNHQIVAVKSAENFIKEQHIEYIDLMKIDAEGADYRVLDSCKTLLERGAISYLIVEYNKGDPCGERCLEILDSYGYKRYFIVRSGDFLVRDYDNYPMDRFKPPLNVLAVSPAIFDSMDLEKLNISD